MKKVFVFVVVLFFSSPALASVVKIDRNNLADFTFNRISNCNPSYLWRVSINITLTDGRNFNYLSVCHGDSYFSGEHPGNIFRDTLIDILRSPISAACKKYESCSEYSGCYTEYGTRTEDYNVVVLFNGNQINSFDVGKNVSPCI